MMLVHHSRKGQGEGEHWEKASGSLDFVNSVRSVLYAFKDNKDQRVMMHVKTNYGTTGPTQGYHIDNSGLTWLGPVDEKKLMTGRAAVKRTEALKWLRDEILRNGPMRATEIKALAEDRGMSWKTVQRAKMDTVEAILRYKGEKRMWFWRLKNDIREPLEVTQDPRPSDDSLLNQDLMRRGE